MKKKLLAVGIAAALGSGVASAAMFVNDTGIGHVNLLPYYSVQEGNTTLISITNTDNTNGKAVKVRFRGAKTSDDVFDFQVFLSPGDVWTASVSQEGDVAKLTTTDKSCTLPQNVNQSFVTARLHNAEKATGTLEGYVEIINMGDIPRQVVNEPTGATGKLVDTTNTSTTAPVANPLYSTTKHKDGVADCDAKILIGTGTDPILHGGITTGSLANGLVAAANYPQVNHFLAPPTSGLTSWATVINVPTSKAFTFAATALSPEHAAAVSYWRQANITFAYSNTKTADLVFAPETNGGGNVTMYEFDLPDLSTPYGGSGAAALAASFAADQRNATTTALAKASVMTEYVTSSAISATTDVVLSQPTRRYFYEWKDAPTAAEGDTLNTLATITNGEFGSVYQTLVPSTNTVAVGSASFTDREERAVVNPASVVISPNPNPGDAIWNIEGEVAVISINNGATPTGSLNASLTAQDYSFDYADGWATLSTTTVAGKIVDEIKSTPNTTAWAAGVPSNPRVLTDKGEVPGWKNGGGSDKLPVIGFTAINVFNASVANGTNYGLLLPLRYTK